MGVRAEVMHWFIFALAYKKREVRSLQTSYPLVLAPEHVVDDEG